MRRCLGVVVVAFLLIGCASEPSELAGYVREPLPEVGGIAISDASSGGEPFTFKAEPAGLLVVYFGYTSCPDVCPTTLAEIRSAMRDLDRQADRVAVAMITVDPVRDTPEILVGYVQSFVADAHALRGQDDAELQRAADAFDVLYEVVVSPDGSVDVGHTASVFVVDDRGRVRVTWPFGTLSRDMSRDLEILLSGV